MVKKMGIIKTSGVVILESNMGDYDKMVTLLTPDYGKIGCSAKGSRRPKSLLLAGTQFLCFGEYMLYKGTNTYHINSCETTEIFYEIRTDLDKLKYASHIAKIVYDVTNENEDCKEIIQLLLNTLYVIAKTDKNLDLILAIFKLRLLCILGFTPNVMRCQNCKDEEDIIYFSLKDNGFKCGSCGKQDPGVIQISKGTRTAIRYIVMKEAKQLYSFSVSENCIKELEIISKLYMNEKLEKEYKLEK